MNSFLVDVSVLSILTGATDANAVNEVLQFLSDYETKIQEVVEVNQLHESSLVGVSRKRVILLFLYRQSRKIQRNWKRSATSEALRTKIDDLARSGDTMPI